MISSSILAKLSIYENNNFTQCLHLTIFILQLDFATIFQCPNQRTNNLRIQRANTRIAQELYSFLSVET